MAKHTNYLILIVFLVIGLVLLFLMKNKDSAGIQRASVSNSPKVEKHFIGAEQCKSCHAEQYQQWQQSDHFRSMAVADDNSVLGDFSDVKLEFHGVKSRLYKADNKYHIDTQDEGGEISSFEISNTFGFYPLQQYLVETKGGHIQALNIAWDSRAEEEGGQQWFHLQPDENITPDHPFHWSNHFQNWNSRCADCHSTNLRRNYSTLENSFTTQFSEINVACEACHGPASHHLELAKSNALEQQTGFDKKLPAALQWQFSATANIAEPLGEKTGAELAMCGSCHALRAQLAPQSRSDAGFHDTNQLQLLNETTYFADGQSKLEAFVVGSFLQSKMHASGVSCANCHNPHTGKTLIEGNALCAQCHKPEVFDTPEHHHHQSDSEGAQCINCHMPQRAFMQVDERRDHSFKIPRPDLSLALGVPNTCVQCHSEKDNAWAQEQTSLWGISPDREHWAYLSHRAQRNDVLVTRSAVQAILNTGLPEMIRASLLEQLSPMASRVSADVARKSLYDKSPLIRRAAAAALRGHDPDLRWQLLSAHIRDPNRGVRMQIAEVLADTLLQLPPAEQRTLSPLIAEYRGSLAISADAVTTQLNLALLELRLGNMEAAELAYLQALKIEPAFVPALLSLADFYRRSNRVSEEQPLLERALELAPDSGGAQHSMGLFLVRQQNYQQALVHLKLALEQQDASPYFAYVYAVALENQGQLSEAIKILKVSDQRWPNQYELLLTLILYLEKAGDGDAVPPFLSRLSALAPSAPAVQQLIDKHQNID